MMKFNKVLKKEFKGKSLMYLIFKLAKTGQISQYFDKLKYMIVFLRILMPFLLRLYQAQFQLKMFV